MLHRRNSREIASSSLIAIHRRAGFEVNRSSEPGGMRLFELLSKARPRSHGRQVVKNDQPVGCTHVPGALTMRAGLVLYVIRAASRREPA